MLDVYVFPSEAETISATAFDVDDDASMLVPRVSEDDASIVPNFPSSASAHARARHGVLQIVMGNAKMQDKKIQNKAFKQKT